MGDAYLYHKVFPEHLEPVVEGPELDVSPCTYKTEIGHLRAELLNLLDFEYVAYIVVDISKKRKKNSISTSLLKYLP
jgi:hypothetical protein